MPPSHPDPGDALVEGVRKGLTRCGLATTDRLVVAASGGVDSMALVHVLHEISHPIVLVHINHGLRAESAEDGAFVAQQAAALGLEARRLAVTVEAGNVQAQAREARYHALAEAARVVGAAAVVTGHTATDQAETVLLALTRGAGLRGLAGMPDRRPLADGVDLARPLLAVSRQQVEAVARARGWAWREDASNATEAYWRNRLRRNVLPALRHEAGEGVDLRIAAAASHVRGAQDALSARWSLADGRVSLADLAGLGAPARHALLAEAVARLAPSARRSRALVERLDALRSAAVGTRVASGGVQVWRERDALRFGTAGGALAGTMTETPLDVVPRTFDADPFSEIVDADLADRVEVRAWQPGDRIRPLGLDGRQSVAEVLRERGVPVSARASVPVVARGADVLWVVGHRLAASVAVTAQTRRAARWSWHSGGGAG